MTRFNSSDKKIQLKHDLELFREVVHVCSIKEPYEDTEYLDMLQAVRWYVRAFDPKSVKELGNKYKECQLRFIGLYETCDIMDVNNNEQFRERTRHSSR